MKKFGDFVIEDYDEEKDCRVQTHYWTTKGRHFCRSEYEDGITGRTIRISEPEILSAIEVYKNA